MDKKTLMIFAQRIFRSSSQEKAIISLRQLKKLLEEPGTDKNNLDLLDQMMESAPEMKAISGRILLTEEDVAIAVRRANERKAREAMATRFGRC